MSTTTDPPADTTLRYDWTKVGAEFNTTPVQRTRLLAVFDQLDAGEAIAEFDQRAAGEAGGWQAVPCTLGMMPAMAIDQIIRQLHVPAVTHVGLSSELSPYGLIALRAHYSNRCQRIELLAVDRGTHVTPLVVRVHPKSATPLC